MGIFKLSLGVVAGIFLMFSAAYAQSGDAAAPEAMSSGAQTTIDSQLKAFGARDHAGAFSHAAPSLQKIFGSTERFIGMVKNGYGAIYDAKGWSFGRNRMKDGILYQEVLITGPDGREWAAMYTMKQQADGSWKIGGVQLVLGAGRST